MRRSCFALPIAAALALSACTAPTPPPPPRELCAGVAATKGPWVLRMAETEATVRWESREGGCTELTVTATDGEPAEPRFVEGAATASEVKTAYGQEVGFKPADEAGTFHIHEVRVTDLEAGRCYRYRTSAAEQVEGRLCTARPAGQPIRFVALGDSAVRWGHTEGVLAAALAKEPDFAIHGGDLQYYASILESWQSWFPKMAPLLRNGAFLPAVGNHENEIPGEFDDYYARLFATPGAEGTTRWYRFSSGGVHFLSVDTESPLTIGQPQRAWLESALAEVKAAEGYRATVVYFHKPIYTLGHHGPRLDLRAELEPLFKANGVSLVIQAHVHGYERFLVGDIVYLTSGGGGAPLYDMDEEVPSHPNDVPLRKAAISDYHSVVITFDDALRGEAINEQGQVIDSFVQPL